MDAGHHCDTVVRFTWILLFVLLARRSVEFKEYLFLFIFRIVPQLNSYPQTRSLPHSLLPLRLLFTTSVTFYSSQHSLIRLRLPAAARLSRSHLGCPCEIMHILASADHWVHLAPHPDSPVCQRCASLFSNVLLLFVEKLSSPESQW